MVGNVSGRDSGKRLVILGHGIFGPARGRFVERLEMNISWRLWAGAFETRRLWLPKYEFVAALAALPLASQQRAIGKPQQSATFRTRKIDFGHPIGEPLAWLMTLNCMLCGTSRHAK